MEQLPERGAIRAALTEIGEPCSLRTLLGHLQVSGNDVESALRRRLGAMVRDGQLIQTRRGRFGLAEAMDLVSGRVLAHRDGYAFVRPEKGGDDIYLAPREARRTLHGDKVLVRVAGVDRRGRPFGNLVEVLERANETIVGRYFVQAGLGYVAPENSRINQDIAIPQGANGGAKQGQIVVTAIEQQPDRRSQPIGRVIEVLGEHLAPGMEIEVAIRSHSLPVDWPVEVDTALSHISEVVNPTEIGQRKDLRQLPLVTIDGADARDFDDAVYARRTQKGFILYVAIADVAHYVQPGSALDSEALNRGTSVYFPDRVIPMLPEKLSNGICSLVANVDRFAMVCELTINGRGEVTRSKFYDAVIRSHARLIYDDVQAWIDDPDSDRIGSDPEVQQSITTLYSLYESLRDVREQRGALDIDTREPRFSYDAGGKIATVTATSRVDAHRVIEECMIAANVAAAKLLLRNKRAAVYRIHETPDSDRVQELGSFLAELGLSQRLGSVAEATEFAGVLAAAKDRPDRRLIETVVLRSLKLAVYSEQNLGHFGLALPAYTHFTSPIRRYPDLLVHRAIKALLRGEAAADPTQMAELAARCSMCERRADEATREAVSWLKCEFMLDKVGEVYDGIITGVVEFGVFVELDDIFVEGLLHVTELPGDYYQFDAAQHALRGRAHKAEFRIGDRIKVRLARVDLDERKIDFSLPPDRGSERKPSPGSKKPHPAASKTRAKSKPKSRAKPAKRSAAKSTSKAKRSRAKAGK